MFTQLSFDVGETQRRRRSIKPVARLIRISLPKKSLGACKKTLGDIIDIAVERPKKTLGDIIDKAVEGPRGSQLDELASEHFEEDDLIFTARKRGEQHQSRVEDVIPRRESASNAEVETVVGGDDSRSGSESVFLRPKEGVDSRRKSAPGACMESVGASESNAEVPSAKWASHKDMIPRSRRDYLAAAFAIHCEKGGGTSDADPGKSVEEVTQKDAVPVKVQDKGEESKDCFLGANLDFQKDLKEDSSSRSRRSTVAMTGGGIKELEGDKVEEKHDDIDHDYLISTSQKVAITQLDEALENQTRPEGQMGGSKGGPTSQNRRRSTGSKVRGI